MSEKGTAHIFLDANTALHFQRPDKIDWCSLTKSDRAILVAAPILHRELESQKVHNSSRKLRERASTYIKWLVQFVRSPGLPVREETVWHFIATEPAIEFHAHNLSPSISDDHLIASVLTYSVPEGGTVYVATADIGLEVKLRHRKIAPLILPEALKLADELDPLEKELQELRRQVAQRRAPCLELIAPQEGQRHPLTIGPEVVSAASAASIEETQRKYPALLAPGSEASKRDPVAGLFANFEAFASSPERIERYNKERDAFFLSYRNHLDELRSWEEQAALTVEIQLTLSNTGTAPAADVDAILTFPEDILLIDEHDLPARPKAPRAPARRGGLEDVRGLSSVDLFRPYMAEPFVPSITHSVSVNSERHEVTYWLKNLKHGFSEKLDAVYVRFSSRAAVRNFHARYQISAAELAEPTEGDLHFVLASPA